VVYHTVNTLSEALRLHRKAKSHEVDIEYNQKEVSVGLTNPTVTNKVSHGNEMLRL
jgi:hypothetical protein